MIKSLDESKRVNSKNNKHQKRYKNMYEYGLRKLTIN